MGNGATFDPWLNDWLRRVKYADNRVSRIKVMQEVEEQAHPVPHGEKEMQVSQNLFLLQAGCEMALHGEMTPNRQAELVTRLKRERDELGLWGSECTSPIYHHFIITGLSAIYATTNNQELKRLIEENLGSFFWYALRMGLADSKHGLIGMRGTGHDINESGFPHLHFICQYFTKGRPTNHKSLSGWKDWFDKSGWVMAGLPGGRSYELYKKVFEYAVDDGWTPWKLRSKLTFVRINSKDAGHFYEKGINGNTPALMAYSRQPHGYLPWNSAIRVRQKHDNAEVKMVYDFSSPTYRWVGFDYRGIYTSLSGGGGKQVQGRVLDFTLVNKLEILTSDLSGVSGWTQIYPSKSVPVEPTPTPTPPRENKKKKKRWWEFWK